MADKHETMATTEFAKLLEQPSTLEFLACRILTSHTPKQSSILHLRGVLSPDHRKMDRGNPEDFHFQASRSDLVEALRSCLDHLEGTPERRIADSLAKIEKHLERIVPLV